MKQFVKPLVLALIIVFSALSAANSSNARPEDARIDDVTVSLSPLRVSFQVKDAFTKEIEEAVRSGIPTSFNFIVELERVSRVWFNEDIGRWEFKHTVKYDTLKDEFEITLDETGEAGIRTKDFGEMKAIMSSGNTAITPAHLVPGEEYEMRIMAELHTVELPPLLNYMLFFVKLWDFETGWYTYRFSP